VLSWACFSHLCKSSLRAVSCRNWELTAPWTGVKGVPVKFIVGELDKFYTETGAKEYVDDGEFKKDVPSLEETVIIKGVGHFLHQERKEEINDHIREFIKKHENN
jgi:pimeloyl-ACP methyl ester carboxylesterase